MSDFNSLDLEHKRQLLFNCGLLNQTVEALQEITGASKDTLMFKTSLIVKEKLELLAEDDINRLINDFQSMLNEHKILKK